MSNGRGGDGSVTAPAPDGHAAADLSARLELARDLGAFTSDPSTDAVRTHPGPGSLSGVRFAVKDNIDLAGVATTAGTGFLDRNVPTVSAPVVRRLLEAGALPVAKTNMHELAMGVTSNNAHFGPVRNPVDLNRSAGGSSGGSAVAVAVGCVPFALGTDTGGSVRIPAAFCGIVGFRPSSGRYPDEGVLRVSWTRDVVGIVAATVHDVLVVDQAIAGDAHSNGPRPAVPIRLGVPRLLWRDLDRGVSDEAVAALEKLDGNGVELVDVDLGFQRDAVFEAGLTILDFECARLLPAQLERAPGIARDGLGLAEIASWIESPDVGEIVTAMAASPVSDTEYDRAMAFRDALLASYRRAFAAAAIHAVIYPTVITTAPVLGDDRKLIHSGRETDLLRAVVANTTASNLMGTPALSLPTTRGPRAGFDLPVGLSVEGLPGRDVDLLRTALEVERRLEGS